MNKYSMGLVPSSTVSQPTSKFKELHETYEHASGCQAFKEKKNNSISDKKA